jgi:hypothetical protein
VVTTRFLIAATIRAAKLGALSCTLVMTGRCELNSTLRYAIAASLVPETLINFAATVARSSYRTNAQAVRAVQHGCQILKRDECRANIG